MQFVVFMLCKKENKFFFFIFLKGRCGKATIDLNIMYIYTLSVITCDLLETLLSYFHIRFWFNLSFQVVSVQYRPQRKS